jgi:cytochrome c-type biogenesis protein CcmH
MLAFLLAAMTAIAIALVGLPILLPRRQPPPARREHDVAVYRDQLGELEREQARGVIDQRQASAARVEIERRLLAAAKAEEQAPAPRPLLRHITLALAAILPLAAFAFYLATGRPDLPAQPFAQRNDPAMSAQVAQRQIDELQRRLAQKPDDLQNWALLGRSTLALGKYREAASAFGRAVALAPDRADILSAYAEALILADEGKVSAAAREALDAALARDPEAASANYYRGAADLQAGDVQRAMERWLALEARSPQDAPYMAILRQQIAAAARDSGIDPLSIRPDRKTPPSGPSTDDVDRLSKLSPQEQQQAIRGMVDGLEAKLKNSPDDIEGWRRLARARMVLGEPDKAIAALNQADSRKPNDPAILADLAETLLRASADVNHPSPQAIAVLRRLLAADANNALALYFLSAVEAEAGNKPAARDMLDRLLKQIPADAPQRAAILAKRKALE